MKKILLIAFAIIIPFLAACNHHQDPDKVSPKSDIYQSEAEDIRIDSTKEIQKGEKANADESDRNISPADRWKRYSIKSGVIEYVISGISGKENLYWDNYGALEARYNKTKVERDGKKIETEVLIMYIDSLFYTINVKEKKGQRINMLRHLEGAKNMKIFNKAMLKELGGKPSGTEVLLGKECNIWEMPDKVRISLYKDIPLKIVFGEVTVNAKSIKENVSIDPKIFVLPQGIEYFDEK